MVWIVDAIMHVREAEILKLLECYWGRLQVRVVIFMLVLVLMLWAVLLQMGAV